jgi:hypothetical protein
VSRTRARSCLLSRGTREDESSRTGTGTKDVMNRQTSPLAVGADHNGPTVTLTVTVTETVTRSGERPTADGPPAVLRDNHVGVLRVPGVLERRWQEQGDVA